MAKTPLSSSKRPPETLPVPAAKRRRQDPEQAVIPPPKKQTQRATTVHTSTGHANPCNAIPPSTSLPRALVTAVVSPFAHSGWLLPRSHVLYFPHVARLTHHGPRRAMAHAHPLMGDDDLLLLTNALARMCRAGLGCSTDGTALHASRRPSKTAPLQVRTKTGRS